MGWTDAQIKVLQKLGGCSERNPSTRTNDEGTHSDVSTPKCRIKIDDEQLLKAPYRGITPPMNDSNFLDQKVWNPVMHELNKSYDDLKTKLFNENHDDDDEMDDTALIYTVERMEESIRCF